ncbi:MAG: hypothetical protein J6A89_08750 [Clostridia bacterium]|nr:hypothetical protein [Clostridia bacterium]
MRRCYSYNRRHFDNLEQDEVIEECRLFLLKKFGKNGYAREKMYFEDEEYNKYLEDITELAENKELFNKKIKIINN